MPDTPRQFCRELSIVHDETIAGSAVESTPFVVALEHAAPWGAKAIPESNLPPVVKTTLQELETRVPGTRPQLIKRDVATSDTTTLLMAGLEADVQRCVRWTLRAPEAIADIDFAAAAAALRAGEPVAGAEAVTEPQLLVCTNGKRDRCCAKWGLPLYRVLAGLHTDTWETTHLGGHRFAATLLWMPTGLCLGRVALEEVPAMLAGIRAGEIWRLDRLRGRIAETAAVQFAEAAWRAEHGRLDVAAYASATARALGEDAWSVEISDAHGQTHTLVVEHHPAGMEAPPSCDKDPAPVMRWRVRS